MLRQAHRGQGLLENLIIVVLLAIAGIGLVTVFAKVKQLQPPAATRTLAPTPDNVRSRANHESRGAAAAGST
jgi:hypothetical protein